MSDRNVEICATPVNPLTPGSSDIGSSIELTKPYADVKEGVADPFSLTSKMFAQGAEGPVTAVQGPFLRTTSTWGTVEYPQLVGKNPITYIGIGW